MVSSVFLLATSAFFSKEPDTLWGSIPTNQWKDANNYEWYKDEKFVSAKEKWENGEDSFDFNISPYVGRFNLNLSSERNFRTALNFLNDSGSRGKKDFRTYVVYSCCTLEAEPFISRCSICLDALRAKAPVTYSSWMYFLSIVRLNLRGVGMDFITSYKNLLNLIKVSVKPNAISDGEFQSWKSVCTHEMITSDTAKTYMWFQFPYTFADNLNILFLNEESLILDDGSKNFSGVKYLKEKLKIKENDALLACLAEFYADASRNRPSELMRLAIKERDKSGSSVGIAVVFKFDGKSVEYIKVYQKSKGLSYATNWRDLVMLEAGGLGGTQGHQKELWESDESVKRRKRRRRN